MDGLERAGGVRGQPQSTTSCSYGMGRFLPRATPFADCMQGGGAGGYPSYASDWGLMQGMYSHHLGVDRSLNGFRTSASHYFPVTPSPKDLASPYPPQPPPPRTGGYDSMTNGTYLCASSPSPSSTCLSPELDKKENKPKGKTASLLLSFLFIVYNSVGVFCGGGGGGGERFGKGRSSF